MKVYQFKNLNLNCTNEEYKKYLEEWDQLKIGTIYFFARFLGAGGVSSSVSSPSPSPSAAFVLV